MVKALFYGTIMLTCFFTQACSLAPTYSRPDVHFPEHMPEAWSKGTVPVDAEGNTFGKNWWNDFGSQTLPELQAVALKRNYLLAAKGWEVKQALAQARMSRAGFFPWAGMEVAASRTGSHPAQGQRFVMNDVVSGIFQASYEVDVWGKIKTASDSADFTAQATHYDMRAAGISLEADVALSYFQYLAQKQRLAVQKDILASLEKTLRFLERQVDAGASIPLNLARQRGVIAETESKIQELQRQAAEAKSNLQSFLGAATLEPHLHDRLESEAFPDLALPGVPAMLPSELLTRRPDVLRAEAALMATNANIGVARAALLPSIQLTAAGGWQSAALHSLLAPESTLYSLVSSLTAPIFQGGKLAAQHDLATARHEELVARYQQTTLNAFLEVDNSIAACAYLKEETGYREETARQAREAYRVVQIQYKEGIVSFLSVLDAQRTMLNAEDALVLTSLVRMNTAVGLFRALGGGWKQGG